MPLAKSHTGWSMRLVRRGDVARGGVVVGAEVRADAAALARGEKAGQRRAAVGAEQRLGDLDHQLACAARRPARPWRCSSSSNRRTSVARLLGDRDLGQRDDEVVGQRAAASRRAACRGRGRACARRARFHSSLNGLMRMPMNGGSEPVGHARARPRAPRRAAVASSSASGRAPKPSSKSMRKSSTGSRSSFARTRS